MLKACWMTETADSKSVSLEPTIPLAMQHPLA